MRWLLLILMLVFVSGCLSGASTKEIEQKTCEQAISELPKRFQLAVVTARPKEISKETIYNLERFFPNSFSEFHFANHKFPENGNQSKSSFCVSNGYKFMIEDSADYARECAKSGISVLLLEQPWNWETLHPRVFRVRNWNEINKYFQGK